MSDNQSSGEFPRIIQDGHPAPQPRKPRYLASLVRAWVVIIIGLAGLGVVIAIVIGHFIR